MDPALTECLTPSNPGVWVQCLHPHLQMNKVGHREGRQLTTCHTARERGHGASSACALTTGPLLSPLPGVEQRWGPQGPVLCLRASGFQGSSGRRPLSPFRRRRPRLENPHDGPAPHTPQSAWPWSANSAAPPKSPSIKSPSPRSASWEARPSHGPDCSTRERQALALLPGPALTQPPHPAGLPRKLSPLMPWPPWLAG